MRTLKKTLCLILCLAMMVGLCAIGASAVKYDDYKDKDKVTYESAVTLLTALGVLEGDNNGYIRPTDELNRAEGAAIMTRLLKKEINMNAVSSFTDMAGYTWAQPYVAFCEAQGVIAGYGNGKFGPGDKLTTSQFAKMLICALGYDAAKEGLVNDAAWEINTTRKVTSLNLAKGLQAYLPGKNIQREQAAQLAYNTLFQPMVYSEGSSIAVSWVGNLLKGGDAIITVKEGTPIPNPSYDYNTNNPIDNVLEFCEAAFPNLKLRTADDVYAVPTNYWFMGKNAQDKVFAASKLICSTIAVPVLARYTTDMATITSARLYNDAGFSGLNLWSAKRGYIDLYENGEGFDDLLVVRNDVTTFTLAGYAGGEALLLDMSELYEGFEDDTDVDLDVTTRLVIKYPYLAKVIAVIPGETRTLTLKVYRNPGAAITINVPSEEYKKGDFVLVYDAGCINRTKTVYDSNDFEGAVIELKPADAKNGTLQTVWLQQKDFETGLNEAGLAARLQVGGEVLNIGANALACLGPNEASTQYGVRAPKELWVLNTGLTAYMSNGYVLGVVPDAVAYSDWVFVYGHDGHPIGSPWDDRFEAFTVGYVNQSAKRFETKVSVLAGATPDTAFWTTVDDGALTDKEDVYEVNKDGMLMEYGLRHDMPELAYDQDGNKIIADSKTVFVLKIGNTFKAITGIHNVPDYAWPEGESVTDVEAGRVYALVPSEGAHAVAVFIDVTGLKGAAIPDADPVYLLGLYPGKKTLDDGTVVYTYGCIKDGKLDVLMSKSPKAELEKEGLVIPIYAGKYVVGVKQITDDPAYILLNASNTTCTFENDTITFGDNTYAVAKDAVAYIYHRGTGKLSVTTADCLPGLPAADITAIATATDKTIKTIYYVYPSLGGQDQ